MHGRRAACHARCRGGGLAARGGCWVGARLGFRGGFICPDKVGWWALMGRRPGWRGLLVRFDQTAALWLGLSIIIGSLGP